MSKPVLLSHESSSSMSRAALRGALLLFLGAVSCSKEPGPHAVSSTPAPESQHGPEATTAGASTGAAGAHPHMAEHAARTRIMREAIVVGDLQTFRVAGRFIAETDIEQGAPETWAPYVPPLQVAAREASKASELEAAALAFGNLGARCADCHRALGSPKFALGVPPPQSADIPRHMDRHHWAAERMWEGLIAPSEQHWIKGAEAMADARLTAEAVAPQTPDVDALARRVHFQANAARFLESKDRGRAYGEFLVTCSTCHQMTGYRPAKSVEE